MNTLDFLKQAQLADNLGYFRLADKLFNKASRVVFAIAFDKALLEALEKAGIRSGERASFETINTAVADAILVAVKTGESAEFRLLAKEAGLTDEAITKYIDQASRGKLDPKVIREIAETLEVKLNSKESILNRMIRDAPDTPPKDVPPLDKPLDTPPSKLNFKQRFKSIMAKIGPNNVKKLLTAAGIALVVTGAGFYFVSVNGDPVSDEEVDAALNGADPYTNMYEDRMKAGQQQKQNEAAQKFVDENKSKYTSQRAFYDAALGAGDKNFANDVIAIVKKDTPELPREPNKSEGKESSSYLNKTPYSGS